MKPLLRQSGLTAVGPVPWGTHFCQFYQSKKDLLDILIPYFASGLKNNELCVWVTSDFLTKEEALEAMAKKVPNFSRYLKKGQIEIFPYTDWYLKAGKFELKRVLKMWLAKHEEALDLEFAGLRVSGNPFWIDNKKDWNDFAGYEAEINKVISAYKLLVLCTYSLDKCGASEIIDVVTNHQFALIKRVGAWERIESTEKKIAEEAARQSENKYKSLFTNMASGFALHQIVLNSKGKPVDYVFLEINDAFEDLTGLKRENVIGKKVTEALPGIEKDPANWIDRYSQVAMTGKPVRFESFAKPLKRWYSVSAYSLEKGYFVAVFDDITERKKAERQLQESENRLNRSQEIAHLGSWELDVTNNVLTWSDEVYRIFGLKPRQFEATYEAFLEAVHPDDRAAVNNAYSGSLRDRKDEYEIEHRIIRKSTGEVRYVHEKCHHIRDESGKIIRSAGMVHDITGRKIAEEALQESDKRLRNLITIVVHELRNYLTPTVLAVDLLEKRKVEDPHIKRALEMIKRQTKNTVSLLRDLSDVSSLEKGRIELNVRNLDLHSIVWDVVETIKPVFKENNQTFQIMLPKKKLKIEADPLRLEQILINLLSNASKYSDSNSAVKVSVKEHKDQILIKVKDQGIGISEDALSSIFDLFSRGAQPSDRKKDGQGIGLYLSRELARLHQGDIYALSKGFGQGSEFILKIPKIYARQSNYPVTS